MWLVVRLDTNFLQTGHLGIHGILFNLDIITLIRFSLFCKLSLCGAIWNQFAHWMLGIRARDAEEVVTVDEDTTLLHDSVRPLRTRRLNIPDKLILVAFF